MILSGFIITIGGINKESISLIQHLKNAHGRKNIQKKKKKKKKKENNLDRAKHRSQMKTGDSGVGLD